MKKVKNTLDFIEKSRLVHGDKYDYPKSIYTGSKEKLVIICPIHGEFEQVAGTHYGGSGCPKCYEDRRGNTLRKTADGFIQQAKIIHGDKYEYSKVVYLNNKKKVEIICKEHGGFKQSPEMHLRGDGCPICRNFRRRKMLYGVAYYDVRESCIKDNNIIMARRYWGSILRRCFSEHEQKHHRTYIGCSVCKEWLLFSNFKKWFDKNYVEGWHIDKDILVKGNKVYSPDTCCFVPNEINALFSMKPRRKGLPHGVVVNKRGKYVARTRINGRETNLGHFNNIEDAAQAYKKAKEAWIKEVAIKWKGKIGDNVFNAIMDYEVDISY